MAHKSIDEIALSVYKILKQQWSASHGVLLLLVVVVGCWMLLLLLQA